MVRKAAVNSLSPPSSFLKLLTQEGPEKAPYVALGDSNHEHIRSKSLEEWIREFLRQADDHHGENYSTEVIGSKDFRQSEYLQLIGHMLLHDAEIFGHLL